MDLVSCRNVLIYLDQELQQRTLPIFHYALKPAGCLFLGQSESLGPMADDFEIASQPRTAPRISALRQFRPRRTMRTPNSNASDDSIIARLSLFTDALMNTNIGLKAVKAAARMGTMLRFGSSTTRLARLSVLFLT